MSLKVVKGFSLQLNLNLKKSEEDPICLSIQDNLPQLVVEQQMCQLIGQQIKGKIYINILKVCKCQFSQEYLYLVENLTKKNKGERTVPVQFSNLESEQEKVKFLTQDQLVNNVILTKNSYEQNEEKITIYDFNNITEIIQLFLNNFWIELALCKQSNQLISKLIFNNVTFVINKIDSSQDLQIVQNPVMQLLAAKSAQRVHLNSANEKEKQDSNNNNNNNRVNQQSNIIRTGYLSMDSKQRIVPLLAQDEGVYKVPLIGLWIQSDENVNDIFLWTLFIEYAKNGAMKKCNISSNQKQRESGFSTIPNYQDVSFMFVWFQTNNISMPLFFEIQITQSSINKCFQKAQLSSNSSVIKFDYRYSKFKPVNIIENGLNHTFEAQDILSKPIRPPTQQQDSNSVSTKLSTTNPQQNNKDVKQLDSSRQNTSSLNKKSGSTQEELSNRTYKSSSFHGGLQSSITNYDNYKYSFENSKQQYSKQEQLKPTRDKSATNEQDKELNLSARDLKSSSNSTNNVSTGRTIKGECKNEDKISNQAKVRSQSFYGQQQNKKNEISLPSQQLLISQQQLQESQRQLKESQKCIGENSKNNSLQTQLKSEKDKEDQLFYKSTSASSKGTNPFIAKNFTQFQQNTLKQHQILYEQNSKIDELEKQIQNLKKELQSSQSKDKPSPRIGVKGSEYSTVKKRSSKSVYNIGSGVGNSSGGSTITNTNESKAGTKFVSRTQNVQSSSPNMVVKGSQEKVIDNISSYTKSEYRNQNSANSQATTTANKSIDSRLLHSHKQDNSFNFTQNYKTSQFNQSNKFLNTSHIDNELTIGQLCSTEKPPLVSCLSTARSNQLRSSIKDLTSRQNTVKTSSSKQLQKQVQQQSSSSSVGIKNIKRSRFLECNDELPRIKFDFSNIQDNEDSDEDSSYEDKGNTSKLLQSKFIQQPTQAKQNVNYQLTISYFNHFIFNFIIIEVQVKFFP